MGEVIHRGDPETPWSRDGAENRELAGVTCGAPIWDLAAEQHRLTSPSSLLCSPLAPCHSPDLPAGHHKDFSSGRGWPSP